jgi:hypothetical protein
MGPTPGSSGSHAAGSSVDERGDLGVELVGFGLEQPDALGGGR